MKKIQPSTRPGFYYLFITLFYIGLSTYASGQNIANYAFAASGGTYTALTTPVNPAFSSGDGDDGVFNNLPIGFEFFYMGMRYSTVSASTNGWILTSSD